MNNIRIANIIWFTVFLGLLALSMIYAYISADAPYYLAMARDIADGLVPYQDIKSIYTPLMMYLNSIFFAIFEDPGYHLFLGFQLLLIITSGLLVFFISKELNVNKKASLFTAIFFSFAVLSSDGIYINLEGYVILCVLLSFWLLLKEKLLLAGFILACSVFFKQYGILNFVPFFLLLMYFFENKTIRIGYFILGALIPALLFFTYYVLVENIALEELFLQLSGSGYGSIGTNRDKSLFTFLIGAKVFLLSVLPILFLNSSTFKQKLNLILICGIIINLIPTIIQNFAHYFILCFPYLFILMLYNIEKFNTKAFVAANLSLLIICGLLFLRILRYSDKYNEQLQIAEKYEAQYPEGSEVFLQGEIRYLYFLNDYKNPVLKEVGYSYLYKPDKEFKEKYDVITD